MIPAQPGLYVKFRNDVGVWRQAPVEAFDEDGHALIADSGYNSGDHSIPRRPDPVLIRPETRYKNCHFLHRSEGRARIVGVIKADRAWCIERRLAAEDGEDDEAGTWLSEVLGWVVREDESVEPFTAPGDDGGPATMDLEREYRDGARLRPMTAEERTQLGDGPWKIT